MCTVYNEISIKFSVDERSYEMSYLLSEFSIKFPIYKYVGFMKCPSIKMSCILNIPTLFQFIVVAY